MECNLKGVNVHYEEFGSGRPLLALHGNPNDHRHMAYSLEPLFTQRTGWRRIYPDLPGMGLTRGPDWITCEEDTLNVVEAFIDAVAPGERFAVAGISYGGYLARGLVHHCGGRLLGVMLTVPIAETDRTKMNLPQHRIIREDPGFAAALRPGEEVMREFLTVLSMPVLQAIRDTLEPAVAIADHHYLQRVGQHFVFSFDVNALAESFPAPALILTGRYDNNCGYREAYQLLDLFPRATFAVLDCASHFLFFEQEPLFRTLVADWLDRVEDYVR